jgi:hypothetical protein
MSLVLSSGAFRRPYQRLASSAGDGRADQGPRIVVGSKLGEAERRKAGRSAARPADRSPSYRKKSILRVKQFCRMVGGARDVPLHPARSEAVSSAVFQEAILRGGVAVQRDIPRRLQPEP